jgi:hypothetical protein
MWIRVLVIPIGEHTTMAMPKPNVSKRRQRLWNMTFLLLGLTLLIWSPYLPASPVIAAMSGVSIILFMGFYAAYMEWREQHEHDGPNISSRAERRRALRQRRKHMQPTKK